MNIDRFEEDLLNSIQAQRCRKLLWAVIELAVDDACRVPNRVTPQDDAVSALRFLLSEDIDGYLMWLDVNAGEFKRRLLEAMYSDKQNKFDESSKRAFRFNHKWYVRNANHTNN
jgi:hypothetical protein